MVGIAKTKDAVEKMEIPTEKDGHSQEKKVLK